MGAQALGAQQDFQLLNAMQQSQQVRLQSAQERLHPKPGSEAQLLELQRLQLELQVTGKKRLEAQTLLQNGLFGPPPPGSAGSAGPVQSGVTFVQGDATAVQGAPTAAPSDLQHPSLIMLEQQLQASASQVYVFHDAFVF